MTSSQQFFIVSTLSTSGKMAGKRGLSAALYYYSYNVQCTSLKKKIMMVYRRSIYIPQLAKQRPDNGQGVCCNTLLHVAHCHCPLTVNNWFTHHHNNSYSLLNYYTQQQRLEICNLIFICFHFACYPAN